MNTYTFYRTDKNLPATKDSWKSSDFKVRRDAITKDYQSKNGGAMPSKNMKYIREIAFDVPERIALYEVQRLADFIKKLFSIECFQISIDRNKKLCRMLFDFYNKKAGACYHLLTNDKIQINVMIVKTLSLPVPSVLKVNWTFYSLKYELEQNHRLLDEVLEECKEKGFSKQHFQVIRDSFKVIKNYFASRR